MRAIQLSLPTTYSPTTLDFFDPHFHIWSVESELISLSVIGGPAEKYPEYRWNHLEEAFASVPEVNLVGGAFLECIVEQKDHVRESEWARSLLPPSVVLCPRVDFSQDAAVAREQLEAMCSMPEGQVVGIRHIINYEPTWPRVPENFLINDTWKENYKLLEEFNLLFELSCNPHQLVDAANFVAQHENIPVVVEHFGCLKDITNEEEMTHWQTGMEALAALPHTYLQISMLPYTDPQWHTSEGKLTGLVTDMLNLWGCHRCFFASNFPVDLLTTTPQELVTGFLQLCADRTREEKEQLFSKTAMGIYVPSSKKRKRESMDVTDESSKKQKISE